MIHAVIQVLLSDTTVTTAIGGQRIYPVYADEKAASPFVVGSIVSNNPNYCKDMPSRMDEVTFRLVTYSKEYHKMDQIDNAMRFSIDGYKGTSEGIYMTVRMVNQQDLQVEGKNMMARATDYVAQVKRTVPT